MHTHHTHNTLSSLIFFCTSLIDPFKYIPSTKSIIDLPEASRRYERGLNFKYLSRAISTGGVACVRNVDDPSDRDLSSAKKNPSRHPAGLI